jgi:hypothetical protein
MAVFTSDIHNKVVIVGPDAITLLDTVWEDLQTNSGAFQFLGSSDPTISNWQPGGAGRIFKVYKFQINNEVGFSCQLKHTWKEGSQIFPHIHWTPGDRGVAESGNAVGWKLDYSWSNIDGVFPSSTTVDLSDLCDGTNDKHQYHTGAGITVANKKISSMIQCVLYRTKTNGDDTWAGITAAQSPALLEFDFHTQISTMGSREELTK